MGLFTRKRDKIKEVTIERVFRTQYFHELHNCGWGEIGDPFELAIEGDLKKVLNSAKDIIVDMHGDMVVYIFDPTYSRGNKYNHWVFYPFKKIKDNAFIPNPKAFQKKLEVDTQKGNVPVRGPPQNQGYVSPYQNVHQQRQANPNIRHTMSSYNPNQQAQYQQQQTDNKALAEQAFAALQTNPNQASTEGQAQSVHPSQEQVQQQPPQPAQQKAQAPAQQVPAPAQQQAPTAAQQPPAQTPAAQQEQKPAQETPHEPTALEKALQSPAAEQTAAPPLQQGSPGTPAQQEKPAAQPKPAAKQEEAAQQGSPEEAAQQEKPVVQPEPAQKQEDAASPSVGTPAQEKPAEPQTKEQNLTNLEQLIKGEVVAQENKPKKKEQEELDPELENIFDDL